MAPERTGHEGHDRVVHLDAPGGEQTQGRVVRAHPLGVPQHRPREPEGADRDDGHEQGEDGRAGGGLDDQPPGGRGQRHAGGGCQ